MCCVFVFLFFFSDILAFSSPVGLRGWDKRLIVSDRAHLGGYSVSAYSKDTPNLLNSNRFVTISLVLELQS